MAEPSLICKLLEQLKDNNEMDINILKVIRFKQSMNEYQIYYELHRNYIIFCKLDEHRNCEDKCSLIKSIAFNAFVVRHVKIHEDAV